MGGGRGGWLDHSETFRITNTKGGKRNSETEGEGLHRKDAAVTDPTPEALAARVLGNGIHEAAISRLVELVPDARVHVQHTRTIEAKPDTGGSSIWAYSGRGSRCKLEELRKRNPNSEFRFATHGGVTQVAVHRGNDKNPIAVGFAHCHQEDPFCRQVGREMAFRRVVQLLPRVPKGRRG